MIDKLKKFSFSSVKLDTLIIRKIFFNNLYLKVFLFIVSGAIFLASYFLSVQIFNIIGENRFGGFTFRSIDVERAVKKLQEMQKRLSKDLVALNDIYSKQRQIISAEIFKPLKCFKREKKKTSIRESENSKVLKPVVIEANLVVKAIAVSGENTLVIINGEEFLNKKKAIIKCSDNTINKCYVRLLKIKPDKVKAYVSYMGGKRRGKVVWLKRGENKIKLKILTKENTNRSSNK